jgi:hypothetical protein
MMANLTHLATLRQEMIEMAAPAGRVLTNAITTRRRPVLPGPTHPENRDFSKRVWTGSDYEIKKTPENRGLPKLCWTSLDEGLAELSSMDVCGPSPIATGGLDLFYWS